MDPNWLSAMEDLRTSDEPESRTQLSQPAPPKKGDDAVIVKTLKVIGTLMACAFLLFTVLTYCGLQKMNDDRIACMKRGVDPHTCTVLYDYSYQQQLLQERQRELERGHY